MAIDSATFDLNHGESDSAVLEWATEPEDKGDWTAIASSLSDSDSITIELFELHERTTTSVGRRGDGSVSREFDGDRMAVARGSGSASTSRSAEFTRSVTGSGTGRAQSDRRLEATRTTSATASPGDASSSRVTISRDGIFYRSAWAISDGGRASTTWSAPLAWQLPTSPDGNRHVLLTAPGIETDHDMLTLSARLGNAKIDALERYQRAGDVDRQTGAYGTFRRIRRDGSEPVTITPPTDLSPPFEKRLVIPEGFTLTEVAPGWYDVTVDFGLEQPRSRDPSSTDPSSMLVDSRTVSLGHGESQSVTLQWVPSGSDVGLYQAIVEVQNRFSPNSTAVTDITVTDSEWTLAFPIATLNLTRRDVRQIELDATQGVPQLSLPLKLDAGRAAIMLAVGSRVDATQLRSIPDGPNTVVDTLPGAELTCDIDAPDDRDVQSGEYVLTGWNMALSERQSKPYDTTLELLRKDD